MTSAELIQNFQEKNRIQLNGNEMRMAIDRILTVNTNNKERESLIREYIVSVYPQIADEFERNRVRTSVENIRSAPKTTAVDFFEEYVNIVSQIVKESSDQFTAEAIENAEKVNKNLEEAEYKHENAVSKYEDAQMFQTSGTNINMSKYRTELDDAQAALSIAKQKKESLTPFTPYESSMDYFGISGLDALKMLNEQLNAYIIWICADLKLRRKVLPLPRILQIFIAIFLGTLSIKMLLPMIKEKCRKYTLQSRLCRKSLIAIRAFRDGFGSSSTAPRQKR